MMKRKTTHIHILPPEILQHIYLFALTHKITEDEDENNDKQLTSPDAICGFQLEKLLTFAFVCKRWFEVANVLLSSKLVFPLEIRTHYVATYGQRVYLEFIVRSHYEHHLKITPLHTYSRIEPMHWRPLDWWYLRFVFIRPPESIFFRFHLDAFDSFSSSSSPSFRERESSLEVKYSFLRSEEVGGRIAAHLLHFPSSSSSHFQFYSPHSHPPIRDHNNINNEYQNDGGGDRHLDVNGEGGEDETKIRTCTAYWKTISTHFYLLHADFKPPSRIRIHSTYESAPLTPRIENISSSLRGSGGSGGGGVGGGSSLYNNNNNNLMMTKAMTKMSGLKFGDDDHRPIMNINAVEIINDNGERDARKKGVISPFLANRNDLSTIRIIHHSHHHLIIGGKQLTLVNLRTLRKRIIWNPSNPSNRFALNLIRSIVQSQNPPIIITHSDDAVLHSYASKHHKHDDHHQRENEGDDDGDDDDELQEVKTMKIGGEGGRVGAMTMTADYVFITYPQNHRFEVIDRNSNLMIATCRMKLLKHEDEVGSTCDKIIIDRFGHVIVLRSYTSALVLLPLSRLLPFLSSSSPPPAGGYDVSITEEMIIQRIDTNHRHQPGAAIFIWDHFVVAGNHLSVWRYLPPFSSHPPLPHHHHHFSGGGHGYSPVSHFSELTSFSYSSPSSHPPSSSSSLSSVDTTCGNDVFGYVTCICAYEGEVSFVVNWNDEYLITITKYGEPKIWDRRFRCVAIIQFHCAMIYDVAVVDHSLYLLVSNNVYIIDLTVIPLPI